VLQLFTFSSNANAAYSNIVVIGKFPPYLNKETVCEKSINFEMSRRRRKPSLSDEKGKPYFLCWVGEE